MSTLLVSTRQYFNKIITIRLDNSVTLGLTLLYYLTNVDRQHPVVAIK